MRTLVAYVPVLHEGYVKFFTAHAGPKQLYIFGPEIIAQFDWLRKDIRALPPMQMKEAIEALGIFDEVSVLNKRNIKRLRGAVILPDEDISRALAKKYFKNAKFEPFFLRWDKENSVKGKKVVPHRNAILRKLFAEAQKSPDMWRQVGAAIYKDKKLILMSHNRHMPSAHITYTHGDPRNNFHKGDHIELSSAIHAEATLISEAAKKGIKLEGTEMYVTTFPCPPCAKLIANSGIKKLYYASGYSMLDGETILKSAGVKIILVK